MFGKKFDELDKDFIKGLLEDPTAKEHKYIGALNSVDNNLKLILDLNINIGSMELDINGRF